MAPVIKIISPMVFGRDDSAMTTTALLNVTGVLISHGFSGNTSSFAVVGNGPLFATDHFKILQSDVVVRFNDLNHKWAGERTDIHVLRHPSWISFKSANAFVTWHVAYAQSQLPDDATLSSFTFETQHESKSIAPRDSRIFPSCSCGDSCLHSQTWAGPSTGAVAISELQEDPAVDVINVFGMNWAGDSTAHIDFKNSTIVSSCCTKCVFHETSSTAYGNQAAFMFLIFVGIVAVSTTGFCLYETERGGEYMFRRMYRRPPTYYSVKDNTQRPLVPLPPPP